MGIGGGTLSVPMHTARHGRHALGTLISVPGALAFILNGLDVPHRPPLSIGYVNLLGFALIVPTSLAAPAGVRNSRILRILLTCSCCANCSRPSLPSPPRECSTAC